MKIKKTDLTLFSEGTNAAAASVPKAGAGGPHLPAAGKSTAKTERFRQLIRGEYKDEFSRMVEGIVRRRLRQERAGLEAQRAALAKQSACLRMQAAKQQALRWQQELEEAETVYPGIRMEEELRDPAFAALLTRRENPLTICEAYEALHYSELRGRLEADAERRAKEALRSRAARPTENGAAAQGGMPPAGGHMTRQEREKLAARAARGEIISL